MYAAPLIGFIVGAGGYMSLAVAKDTYTGKMPGPASTGYFIAAITGATVLGLTFMSRKQGYLAEQKTARVRTMSGKPVSETLRKLKQDKNLSAKDARIRKEIKAENMEVFEAPKTMTKLQAKRKFIALMKPYWLKDLKAERGPKLSRKQYIAKYGDDEHYEMNMGDWGWWDYHVKTVQNGKYADADTGGDTILREALPHSYWAFINYLPIEWEGSEKYDDDPYETMYLDIDYCIYNREVPWSEWSAADKRKLRKLENNDDMDFWDYIEQKGEIEDKYNKTVQHRTEASKMNCKHCGPYFKNRRNINNWDILSVAEKPGFYEYWNYPAALKKQVKALIPALKGIKPKPKARAKKTTTKPKAKAAKKTTKAKAKPKAKAKAGRKAPTISATRRKIGTRMRGNDGNMWQVKKSGKSQRWMAGAETFEAPRRKRLDFVWIGEDSSDKEWAKSGSNTIKAAIKKAKSEGWKPVMSPWSSTEMKPATRKSRMRREAKVWNLMSKSPQWKPWLKFLTERNADREMSETMDIFRGKAYWKAKNRNSVSILGTTQDYGPWIYDEDRIYVPDHFSEDGGHQVLVKGNQALLLYYIADYDGPYTTPLMRKTFNLSPVKAIKTAKKAKPKATKKSGKSQRWMAGAESFEAEVTAQPVMWDEYGLEGDNDGRAYGIHFTDGYEVYDVHWFATAKERDAYMKEYNEDFSAESESASEGQLAQALERARTSPAPPPLEITSLPKICLQCRGESPQAFGLFDENDKLIDEHWFCDTVCADKKLKPENESYGAQGLSQFTPGELTQSSAIHGDFDHASLNYSGHQNTILRAEGDYNDFIEDMEGVMGKYGEMKDFDSGYNPKNNLLKARMVVEVDDEDFGDVDFEADDFGDMEYILLVMLTDEQLEEEYGDFMRDEGIGRKELPQRLQDRYRTGEEAEYLREKYLEPRKSDCESCGDTEGEGKTDKYGYFCNTCREEYPEDFDAEGDVDNFHEEPIMVIGEPTNLPDADSWIIYMHESDEREQDSRFADLFFVRGPGQFIRTSNYQKTAKVIGGYAPFHITQNLSRDGWLASSTTIAKYTDEPDARSLSVGDVVCDADTGRCFIVANLGYLPLEPTELFEAPLARRPISRFKPKNIKNKSGYWRKRGKDSIFRKVK